MSAGLWLALVPPGRVLPLDELAVRLATLPDVEVHCKRRYLTVEVYDRKTGRRPRIVVGLNIEPYVKLESAEIAAMRGSARSDRDMIAAADARYELTWHPRVAYEAYNTLVRIAEEIERASGVVIYNPAEGSFV
ncbi:hypothetical protein LBMAG42_39580 [Deltaproteobacteria bacterium]|nr:hypothetical protein LBMAG42_39580 [Deltaproteobacteria bacterium]